MRMTVIDVKRLERAVRGHVYQYALAVGAALPANEICSNRMLGGVHGPSSASAGLACTCHIFPLWLGDHVAVLLHNHTTHLL